LPPRLGRRGAKIGLHRIHYQSIDVRVLGGRSSGQLLEKRAGQQDPGTLNGITHRIYGYYQLITVKRNP
jgi:hypothetical protein